MAEIPARSGAVVSPEWMHAATPLPKPIVECACGHAMGNAGANDTAAAVACVARRRAYIGGYRRRTVAFTSGLGISDLNVTP